MKKMILVFGIGMLLLLTGCGGNFKSITNDASAKCASLGYDGWRFVGGLYDTNVECQNSETGKIQYLENNKVNSYPVRELGQAICDQEYKQDFDYYFDGELYCKDKINSKKYDGILIASS